MPHRRLAHVAPFASEPLVFFTVVTLHRRPFLANPFVHETLREIWERSASLNGWWVGDYLLMPDHVHFFARASRTADGMKNWVGMWKSVSARLIARKQGIEGSVWQENYFDRYLRSGENYSEKWAYVEANPVRAGLAADPESWPYRGRIHVLRF
ncbi:MAG TPA: transposase [Kiritimatiellia bacterium]|nr:transposase [Kiritimatiellia bacterium]